MRALVGLVTLLTAIVGSIAGLSAYALYDDDTISADSSATLILVSVVCSLLAAPIGFVAWRRAQKRRHEARLAQTGMFLAVATLAVWFFVVADALGK